jgi:hypothetical protein
VTGGEVTAPVEPTTTIESAGPVEAPAAIKTTAPVEATPPIEIPASVERATTIESTAGVEAPPTAGTHRHATHVAAAAESAHVASATEPAHVASTSAVGLCDASGCTAGDARGQHDEARHAAGAP